MESRYIKKYSIADSDSIRLFCFHCAGGGASLFNGWRSGLSGVCELLSVQLPGREDRISEQPFESMDELIPVLEREIKPYLERPYVFYGHSMGADVVYELAKSIEARDTILNPLHIFVSASRAPHIPDDEPSLHDASEERLVAWLKKLGGIPDELLESKELMELFLPTLRADTKLLENYDPGPRIPLKCSITGFGGDSDPKVSEQSVRAWAEYTLGDFDSKIFAGKHFFINDSRSAVIGELKRRFRKLCDSETLAGGSRV